MEDLIFVEVNDCDTVVAHSVEEAVEFCRQSFGIDYIEENLGIPREVPPDNKVRLDIDNYSPSLYPEPPHYPRIPYRDALAADLLSGVKVPYLFCTTEW